MMKISLDIRIIRDADGKRALRIWPEVDGTSWHKALAAAAVTIGIAVAFYALVLTDVPSPQPSVDVTQIFQGGY